GKVGTIEIPRPARMPASSAVPNVRIHLSPAESPRTIGSAGDFSHPPALPLFDREPSAAGFLLRRYQTAGRPRAATPAASCSSATRNCSFSRDAMRQSCRGRPAAEIERRGIGGLELREILLVKLG